MILTTELAASINAMSIEELLRKIRFTPVGDLLFEGESGAYIMKRYAEIRAKDPAAAVAASKFIGWDDGD